MIGCADDVLPYMHSVVRSIDFFARAFCAHTFFCGMIHLRGSSARGFMRRRSGTCSRSLATARV